MADDLKHVHPAFRAGIEAASRALAHEGPLAAENGAEIFEAAENGTRLQLAVCRGKILHAAHQGAKDPAQQAVLDTFCGVVQGLPMQEAADHAGHHVVARLRDPDAHAPVPGILTPWNADGLFHEPMRLLRAAQADYRARHGIESVENLWNPTISKDWLRLDEPAQIAHLTPVLSDFLAAEALAPGDAQVVAVEYNIRVVLAFAEHVKFDRKPRLLMGFERMIRAATGDRLEVFAEEMKDSNKIRRL